MTQTTYPATDFDWLEPLRAKTAALKAETAALKAETRMIQEETARSKEQKFYLLCKSLLQAIDAGNKEAEESVLCRIRVAVREMQ
jgi:hypothetical protein